MKKSTAIKIVIYFLGLIMPILAMFNCDGFHEGSMQVTNCIIDSDFIRSYANFYFGWITISSFMLFIPVILYIVIVVKIAKYASKVV